MKTRHFVKVHLEIGWNSVETRLRLSDDNWDVTEVDWDGFCLVETLKTLSVASNTFTELSTTSLGRNMSSDCSSCDDFDDFQLKPVSARTDFAESNSKFSFDTSSWFFLEGPPSSLVFWLMECNSDELLNLWPVSCELTSAVGSTTPSILDEVELLPSEVSDSASRFYNTE